MENLSENAKIIFRRMCRYDQHWASCNVYSIRSLSVQLGMTKYAVRKAINELRTAGLVERTCSVRPAVVSFGECIELEREAMPPLNGFGLTSKAIETEIYKEEEEKNVRSSRRWAEME